MRKICFVITSHIHYDRCKLILRELRDNLDVNLQIIVGASAIIPNYGDVLPSLEKDGFKVNEKLTMTLEGGNSVAMAKTVGIGILEFTTAFDNLKPDIVVIKGDRYEILAAAIAASYLNIPVAHIEGGDVSGTIDESVRHAVTKLSHIHFPTNKKSLERLIRMGENPDYVFDFGSPEMEFAMKNNSKIDEEFINKIGVGDTIDLTSKFILVMQHPVTTDSDNREKIDLTLQAVHDLGIPAIWFWPNVDAGTDEISKGIRAFREHVKPKKIRFIKFIPAEQFIGLLKASACLVGNSSAGIKECSYLGTPVVNIGTRQNSRLRAENVLDVNHNKEEIKQAILKQLERGQYEPSEIYYKPDTAKNIVNTLLKVKLYNQKTFID